MFIFDILFPVSGPFVILFTLFSLKRVGLDSVITYTNGKDRKLIPFFLMCFIALMLYMYRCLPSDMGVVAVYTLLFFVIPSSLILWFIMKKNYIRKAMVSALTSMHLLVVLSVTRIINYNYMDFDDGFCFWLICCALLMCYGMHEGGKTKKKLLMLILVAIAILVVFIFGKINVINIAMVSILLIIENIVLFVMQSKLRIFRNVIRQVLLFGVTIGFMLFNINY